MAMFSDCYSFSATLPGSSIPGSKADDTGLESDVVLSEELSENALGPQHPSGSTRVIVIGDVDLWKTMRALDRLSPYTVLEPREVESQEPGVSVFRRDTKRCMVGRVYRPCWQGR